jgi:tRNA-specific 2-thiouridylase
VDTSGNVLGKHKGLTRYTIGQRKGLGIAFHSPLYVKAKDAAANTVTLCGEESLYSRSLQAVSCNWIIKTPKDSFRAKVKIRCRQTEEWAVIFPCPRTAAHILFDEPQRAIAPGQHAVVYDGDTIIGGGVIA